MGGRKKAPPAARETRRSRPTVPSSPVTTLGFICVMGFRIMYPGTILYSSGAWSCLLFARQSDECYGAAGARGMIRGQGLFQYR